MTNKEKMTQLLNMGFTMDESLALVNGNYRTVPDPQEPQQEPQPEQQPEQQPEPQQEQQPEKPDMMSYMEAFGKSLAEQITSTLIQNNIATQQQPPQQTTEDILSLMLEPKAPEMGGKNGSK